MVADQIALNLREASRASALSRTTLYALINAGVLPSLKIAGRRLVMRADLEALLQSRKEMVPAARRINGAPAAVARTRPNTDPAE